MMAQATFLAIQILETLVEHADALNTVPRLLFTLELESHLDLLELLAFVRKLVGDDGVLVVGGQYSVFAFMTVIGLLLLQSLVKVRVVFTELRYAEIECDDLGTGLATRYLDQVVHEEA